jgi:hypothetical protein
VNPVTELRQSFRGWAEILAAKPAAGAYFRTDAIGLATALGWFLVALLLSVAGQSAANGMPSLAQFSFGLLAQAVTLALLGITMAQTLRFLKLATPLNVLLVPAVYALAAMFIVAIPLSLIGPNAALLAVLAVAYFIFCSGRALAGMSLGIAIAFAVLCLIVLVVVPNALYIVLIQIPSPA